MGVLNLDEAFWNNCTIKLSTTIDNERLIYIFNVCIPEPNYQYYMNYLPRDTTDILYEGQSYIVTSGHVHTDIEFGTEVLTFRAYRLFKKEDVYKRYEPLDKLPFTDLYHLKSARRFRRC